MQNTTQSNRNVLTKYHLNVPWVFVGYCYFIWFHLLPSFFLSDFLPNLHPFPRFPIILWYIGGIMVVSGYIGFRSRGFTVIEPGISSVVYLWTAIFFYVKLFAPLIISRVIMMVGAFSVIIFVAACLGALLGEYLQAMMLRNNKLIVSSEG